MIRRWPEPHFNKSLMRKYLSGWRWASRVRAHLLFNSILVLCSSHIATCVAGGAPRGSRQILDGQDGGAAAAMLDGHTMYGRRALSCKNCHDMMSCGADNVDIDCGGVRE